MMRPRTIVLLSSILLGIGVAVASALEPPAILTMTLERPVHFTAPDGSDALASPGSYGVEAGEGPQLRLSGAEGKQPLVIQAVATSHQEALTAPIALSVADEGDDHHIVLLLPGGAGLDAAGSSSSIRSRGVSMVPLPSARLQVATSQVRAAPTAQPPPAAAVQLERAIQSGLQPKISGTIVPPSVGSQANLIFFTVKGQQQGKLKGEVARPGFQDKMQGLKFDYDLISPRDAATGRATGRRQHQPIRLTKMQGAASPQLFAALVRNELLPEVIIDFLAAGVEGQVTPVQTIKLTNAFLAGIRQYTEPAETGIRSLEDVVFTFQTIETTNYAGKTTASDSLR